MASISSCSRRAAREASMRSSHPTLSVLVALAAATPRWNAIAQARSPMECDSNSVSARHPDGSAILSAHDIQMAELDASWRAALAHVCFTAKGRGPKVGAARGAEFKVIPHCGFGRSRARNTNIPRRTQNRICTDMYAQASVYTCSRVGRICRHRSQATSFDGRQLTRYSTQKILVLSPAFTQDLFKENVTNPIHATMYLFQDKNTPSRVWREGRAEKEGKFASERLLKTTIGRDFGS